MKKTIVTVIIPVYNCEKYIRRCLDSVLRQTFQDFEILVINDGSKDKTGEILAEYAKKDKRIRHIEQKNMGVAKTRDKAVRMAKGKFIAFIDNDDYIDKDYLKKLLPRGDEDVVISGYRRPDWNGEIKTEVKLKDAFWSRLLVIAPWAKIYRKDFIIDNDLRFLDNDIGEDIYFNLIAMLIAKKVKILDYVGYNWYYNQASVSNTKHRNYTDSNIFGLLNACYGELVRRGLLNRHYEIIEYYFYRFVVFSLLFAAKGAKKVEINEVYDGLFRWLENKFPKYKHNKFIGGNLVGEVKSTKLICRTFMVFHKMKLGKKLVWLYARL